MHDSIKNFHLTLDAMASECAGASLVESNVDFKGMFGSKIKNAIGWGLPRPMKQSAADRWHVVKAAEIDDFAPVKARRNRNQHGRQAKDHEQ